MGYLIRMQWEGKKRIGQEGVVIPDLNCPGKPDSLNLRNQSQDIWVAQEGVALLAPGRKSSVDCVRSTHAVPEA